MPRKLKRKSSAQGGGSQNGQNSRKNQRDATVYDAVAGRCSTQRFIPSTPYTSRTRDTATSSTLPIPPEEVLFRRLGAPERDIHDDFYWADRHLSGKQTLPDSDLLKAVHAYAADFYTAMGKQGEPMFRSMDDTALLAVGILLEEAADEVLGETGDMVFVEGVRVGETQKQRMPQREREHTDVIDEVQQPQDEDEKPPAKKRRRTKKDKGKKRALDLDDSGQGHDLEI